ncbi:MAG: hypothetical protein FWG50_03865 [Kiritimatiellaeota bacterium]|nr:hypothetical protein [Kiritimatiellota bacterium]
MTLHTLSLTVTDDEVVAAIRRTFEMNKANLPPEAQDKMKNVKDLNLIFADGHIVVNGKFVMGFIPVPFEAHCELSAADGGETLAVRLAKVKASFFSGNGAALISALFQQAPPIDGLTASGDTLLVRFAPLLAQRGISVTGRIRTIDVRPGQLSFAIA